MYNNCQQTTSARLLRTSRAIGWCFLLAGLVRAQTMEPLDKTERRYEGRVKFDDGPAALISPTQTEKNAEFKFKSMSAGQSASPVFNDQMIPFNAYSVSPVLPADNTSNRKKNWLLPNADKTQDGRQESGETGWGWLANRVDQIQQERKATSEEEEEEPSPPSLDGLTKDGQPEKNDRQQGFQTQLFEPVLPADIQTHQHDQDSPDNLLAGRTDVHLDTQATRRDATEQPELETPTDLSNPRAKSDIQRENAWNFNRTESDDKKDNVMFSQTRELLSPLSQQRGTKPLQQPLQPLAQPTDQTSLGDMQASRPLSDRAVLFTPGLQQSIAPGLGTGLRPILSEPTRLPGLSGFQNEKSSTSADSLGALQPLRPAEASKPLQDVWSLDGQ